MSSRNRRQQVAPPLMHAFRSAFDARDARTPAVALGADGEPNAVPRRVTGRNAISEPALRREVTRDIVGLLNTVNLDSAEDLSEFPEVRRSVLNHGLPDILHRSIDELGVAAIGAEVERALVDFEPRLVREGLTTTRDTAVDKAELKLRFVVRADLLCNPVNVPVEFTADVDIDTGKIRIDRL